MYPLETSVALGKVSLAKNENNATHAVQRGSASVHETAMTQHGLVEIGGRRGNSECIKYVLAPLGEAEENSHVSPAP